MAVGTARRGPKLTRAGARRVFFPLFRCSFVAPFRPPLGALWPTSQPGARCVSFVSPDWRRCPAEPARVGRVVFLASELLTVCLPLAGPPSYSPLTAVLQRRRLSWVAPFQGAGSRMAARQVLRAKLPDHERLIPRGHRKAHKPRFAPHTIKHTGRLQNATAPQAWPATASHRGRPALLSPCFTGSLDVHLTLVWGHFVRFVSQETQPAR